MAHFFVTSETSQGLKVFFSESFFTTSSLAKMALYAEFTIHLPTLHLPLAGPSPSALTCSSFFSGSPSLPFFFLSFFDSVALVAAAPPFSTHDTSDFKTRVYCSAALSNFCMLSLRSSAQKKRR